MPSREFSLDPEAFELFDYGANIERPPDLSYVIDAIESLPPHQQDVVNALFWERMSQRQLAKRLGVSRGTVAAMLRQAITAMRIHIEEDR